MRRYAFLDRDGTLVPEYPDEEWRGRTTLTLGPESPSTPGLAEWVADLPGLLRRLGL